MYVCVCVCSAGLDSPPPPILQRNTMLNPFPLKYIPKYVYGM